MKIEPLEVGMLGTNCYVISDDSGCAAVVDPGDDAETIIGFLKKNKLECEAILLTHGHFDHIGALQKVASFAMCPIYVNEADIKLINSYRSEVKSFLNRDVAEQPSVMDRICTVKDNDTIAAGELHFKVIATPGHTKGSVCYLTDGALFSGDTLFRESAGRTDFPGGSFDEIRRSLIKLRDLPEQDMAVYPGHMESTTLSHERKYNPFIER